MRTMTKQLPVNAKPPIYSFLIHGVALSVMSVNDMYMPWFHSHYIQLRSDDEFVDHRDWRRIFVNFYEPYEWYNYPNPVLKSHQISREMLAGQGLNFVDFLINSIDAGQYVYLFADEYYIPHKPFYQKIHYAHDVLVYGYDAAGQTFDILGYNETMEFAPTKVKFAELEHAYREAKIEGEFQNNLILFRLHDSIEYPFDLQQVYASLEDYYLSRNSSERFRWMAQPNSYSYGLSVYDSVLKYLGKLMEDPDIPRLIIPLHVIYEHKQCMKNRLAYMEKLGVLQTSAYTEAYEKMERIAFIARKAFYKYVFFMQDDTSLVQKCIEELQALRELERSTLGKLLNDLRMYK